MQSGKLVLVGSKRLLVRGIKHFEVTFDSLYQIILGTNGSGKSTVLSELSPLPAIPKMFVKGGRKEYHCKRNGSEYVLINDFETASGKHSFIVDGIDLNENGTSTIQKELVKKHFNNLTPELFNVLTFRKFNKFTEMDTNKRRQWMMMLSGIDLDWAMEVYQALRTRSRDASGHFKRVQTKLASEIQMSVDDSAVEEMQAKLNKMQEDFKEALKLTKEGVPTLDELEKLLAPKMSELHRVDVLLDKCLNTLYSGMETFGISDKENLPKIITFTEATLDSLDKQLIKAYEDRRVVSGELDKLKDLGSDGLTEYKTIISGLEDELKATNEAILELDFEGGIDLSTQDVVSMGTYLDNLVSKTIDKVSSMFDNSTGIIQMDKTDEWRTESMLLKTETSNLVEKRVQIKHLIEHAKEVDQVECPSCLNVFKPGIRVNVEVDAPIALQKVENRLVEIKTRSDEIDEYLNQVQQYVTGLGDFEQLQTMYYG